MYPYADHFILGYAEESLVQIITGKSTNLILKKEIDFNKYTDTDHDNLLNKLFVNTKEFLYDDLIKTISKIDDRGINNSKSYIKFLKDKNYLNKTENNLYYDSRCPF